MSYDTKYDIYCSKQLDGGLFPKEDCVIKKSNYSCLSKTIQYTGWVLSIKMKSHNLIRIMLFQDLIPRNTTKELSIVMLEP